MKKLMITFKLLALVLVLSLPVVRVNATGSESTTQEIITYTEVRFSAIVPPEHEGDVRIALINPETQKKSGVILNADNNYMDSTNVLGGITYDTKVVFVGNGEWKCDVAEQYEIPNGEPVDIIINVRDGSLANNILGEENVENDVNEVIADAPHSEDIDPNTNLLKGEVVIQNFTDKVSFIVDEEEYKYFWLADSSEFRKQEFLEHNTLNTEERWNKMSDIDKFVWNVACKVPFCYMYESASLEDYIDSAIGSKLESLENNNYPNKDVVKEALIELCEWHYSYYLHTGTVYDYFNGTNEYINDIGYQESEEKNIIEQQKPVEEEKELEELREEILNELTDEEKEVLGVEVASEKSAFLPIVLIGAILMLVAVILILLKKQNKQ